MNELNTPNKNELSDQELRMYCVEQAVKARASITEKSGYEALAQEAAWLYIFIKGLRYYATEDLSIDPDENEK